MTMRTIRKAVTFRQPFALAGVEQALPAGTYTVETDEELLEGVSFPAYRRTSTVIHLRAPPSRPGVTQIVAITPDDLEAAIRRDQASAEIPVTLRPHTDRRAIERGENEGMQVLDV